MVRRISQRLHWPKSEHQLQAFVQPAEPVGPPADPPKDAAPPSTPPWILPPVAKAAPRPEART